MVDVISSIGNAINVVKRLKEVDKNIESAEYSNLLADLSLELADTKMALVDLKEENTLLKSQLLKVNDIDKSQIPIYENPYYFLRINDKKDGPYCQKCYDSIKKLMRLQETGRKGFWSCHECKCKYKDSDYKPRKAPTVKGVRLSNFNMDQY